MCPISFGKIGAGSANMPFGPRRNWPSCCPCRRSTSAALEALEAKYRMAIPPYYFSLIDPADPLDPIRLQAVPSPQEAMNGSSVELNDPLEEDRDSPVPGITHRYPDRALVITTPVCSMYCRFCTRKRVTMDRDGWDAPSHDEWQMIEYIRRTTAIRDVILSGGDPLTLPIAKLRWFVEQLAAIDHVDVIRVGTRVPVTLPQRLFDAEVVDLLAEAEKVWIQTHFNHPREITPEATRACRVLVNAGMPVHNHSVLLKGVNDSVETMRELVRGLLRIKVRPYYLFHCDPVTGAGHFRTSAWKGIEIIEGAARPCFRAGGADVCDRWLARRGQNSAFAELFDFGFRKRVGVAELRGDDFPLHAGRSSRRTVRRKLCGTIRCRRKAWPRCSAAMGNRWFPQRKTVAPPKTAAAAVDRRAGSVQS